MPLAGAVRYLQRYLKIRGGLDVKVRLVDTASREALANRFWQGTLPVVMIEGRLFSRGTISLTAIERELHALKQGFL